ncbi:MAG: CPBP family intramembrane metalloprotease, partial [Planctomycetia bacterium]|nr:CPBP family intramembrane metalloprotease [Planctomycetia bacterium]
FEHPNAHQLLRLLGHDSGMAMRVAVVISAAVLAPLFEEMLFRGHMQTAILYTISRPQSDSPRVRWAAIFVTSIFFTLVHGELWLMQPIFLLSICLGYAYERTGNLWVPILIHASFNAANLAVFLLQPPPS